MPHRDLALFFENTATTTVLCVGDIMLDRFVYGEATRLSPEAPVPVLKVVREIVSAGGAGNVAMNIAALGARVMLIGVVGDDAASKTLHNVCAVQPDIRITLFTDAARPTISKTRYVAGGQHVLRVDDEVVAPINTALEDMIISAIETAISQVQALVLSDYGKGVLTKRVLAGAITAAQAKSIPIIVDPKGANYARYAGATIITPNRKELAEASDQTDIQHDAAITQAARTLITQHNIGTIVATRSEQGLSVITKTDATHVATEARAVYDVSGAGDTVVAVLATGVARGLGIIAAATLANQAAGLAVEKIGTSTVTQSELKARVFDATATAQAVLTWDMAAACVQAWQAQGLRVGFTNGCFDVLHKGHVTLLQACRAHCDRLLVGINADASVTRLKGPARPVNAAPDRAAVLMGLASVDGVVVFGYTLAEGDTPAALIEALRPDMLFKGGDYTEDTVVGAPFVRSIGGTVHIIPLVDGYSSTASIKKIKGTL